MKFAIALLVFSFGLMAQTPDNTVISTGFVSNYQVPYHPAPYAAYGQLVNSASSALPTYAGIRYEFYLDSTGKPAYAGLAFIKPVVYHKGRYAVFADTSLGAAGTVSSISSAFTVGGGVAVILGPSSAKDPHWSVIVEPQARRIPALANGTNPALLVGVTYSFNRPQ